MKQTISKYIHTIYAITVGAILGLFIGIFIIGSIIRIILDAIFGYGDSGPIWVSAVIVVETIIVLILVTRKSTKWMNDYLTKKKNM